MEQGTVKWYNEAKAYGFEFDNIPGHAVRYAAVDAVVNGEDVAANVHAALSGDGGVIFGGPVGAAVGGVIDHSVPYFVNDTPVLVEPSTRRVVQGLRATDTFDLGGNGHGGGPASGLSHNPNIHEDDGGTPFGGAVPGTLFSPPGGHGYGIYDVLI